MRWKGGEGGGGEFARGKRGLDEERGDKRRKQVGGRIWVKQI